MLRHCLILAAAVTLAYANSFESALVFDSPALTIEDARVTSGDVRAILTSNYWGTRFASGLYRPVASLSYALDYAIHGETRTGYHLVNFALHIAAVLLAYGVVASIAGPTVALWSALLWAVHPIGTEAVTNVAGRPDLLAACCVWGGFLLYRRRSWVPLVIVATFGMFSKESAVVLLGMVLLYDAWSRHRPWFSGIAAIAVPSAVITAIHLAMPMSRPFVDNPLVAMGWWQSRTMALQIMGRMLALWVWPATLSADYSFGQAQVSGAVPWSAAVFMGAILVSLYFLRHRQSFFWIMLAFGAMLPTSNLIVQSGSIMAERFLYVPGLALAVLVVMGVESVATWIDRYLAGFLVSPIPTLALLAICTTLAARTIARNEDYRDDLVFWRATAAASPGSFKARSQYAAELAARGELSGATEQIDAAVRILAPVPDRDNVALSWTQAASYYAATGRTADAHMAAERVAGIYNAAGKAGGK